MSGKDPSPAGLRLSAMQGAIWGHELPARMPGPSSDDFEARVRRAWEHFKAAYFAAEEHDRLREVLAARIEGELVPGSGERRGQDDGRN